MKEARLARHFMIHGGDGTVDVQHRRDAVCLSSQFYCEGSPTDVLETKGLGRLCPDPLTGSHLHDAGKWLGSSCQDTFGRRRQRARKPDGGRRGWPPTDHETKDYLRLASAPQS